MGRVSGSRHASSSFWFRLSELTTLNPLEAAKVVPLNFKVVNRGCGYKPVYRDFAAQRNRKYDKRTTQHTCCLYVGTTCCHNKVLDEGARHSRVPAASKGVDSMRCKPKYATVGSVARALGSKYRHGRRPGRSEPQASQIW